MSICAKGPVNLYLEEYRDEFAALLREFIADAIQAKGINEADNAVLAREIYLHVIKKQHLETHYFWMLFLFLLPIAAAVIWCFILVARCMADKEVSVLNWCSFALFAAFTIYIIGWQMIPRICKLEKEMEQLASLIAQKKAVALAQLRPLYDCFDWNTGTKLMEKLLPQLKFDDYLPAERLADLKKNFHFNTDLGQNRSVLYTHSGTFHGYPFCFLHNRLLTWGSKTYHGSKVIHWTERVRNSEGKYVTVYRSQVLTASVTKPYPEFSGEKIFIFGHDAAPKLSFSRTPSSLSGAEKSLFNTIGRKIKFQELRDLEQNLTDDNGFTMMSNREFELLFNSTNRSDEIGYRLLFTPLAQQHMVTLLNDKKAGFGDDFYYSKKNKITTITSRHLQNFAFSTEPMVLNEYDLKVAKQRLFSRYMEFFRKVYFTLAPLFTIPLYNEARNYIPPIEEEKNDFKLGDGKYCSLSG